MNMASKIFSVSTMIMVASLSSLVTLTAATIALLQNQFCSEWKLKLSNFTTIIISHLHLVVNLHIQMDSFEINNFKVQKTNGNLKHHQLRKISNLIRIIEICAVVVLVSRFSIQLPLVVQNSSKYFKDLTVVLVSPLFAFIIGNMIVVFLFAQSRQFTAQDSTRKNPGNNSYAEFSEKDEKTKDAYRYEAKYREKQNICEEKIVTDGTYSSCKHRSYRRILSENLKRVSGDKPCRELRRSGTEKYRKSTNSGKRLVKNSYSEDDMSNEEFRHMIEAFITKQHNFRLKEEYSVI